MLEKTEHWHKLKQLWKLMRISDSHLFKRIDKDLERTVTPQNSGKVWIFIKFSRSYCIVFCSILPMYTPLYSQFEKQNNEREKVVHSLKHESCSQFSHTDLPLQFCANHYHLIFLWAHQSIKTAVFAHIRKMFHVFICMYKIFFTEAVIFA